MKKSLLIVAALALALGASSVMAESNWNGLFWEYWDGPTSGTWAGTIYDDPTSDNPHFEGVWIAQDGSGEHGTLYAPLYTGGPGSYRTTTGIIYDSHEHNIGSWRGTFEENTSHAEGRWSLDATDVSGEWLGSISTP